MSEPLTHREPSNGQVPEAKFGRSVSLVQAAQLLHVSRRTIYNRIRDGQLATIKTHGSQRVLLSSLLDLGLVAPPTVPSNQQSIQL